MLITLLAMIVVLGVLIFVHELGHFMTAKAVDIEVPRFSIGFGPKILGFRRGETEYVISLLPFGGYVKMAGMEEMEAIEGGEATITEMVEHRREDAPRPTPRPRDFEAKPLWARALVISAGVLMNLLFAFVVFTVSAMIWGVARDPGPSIAAVTEELLPEGAAALATIPPGAVVTRIGEDEVSTWRELQRALLTARAGDTEFVFRDGQRVTVALPSADSLRGNLINAIQPAIAPILGALLPGGPGERGGLEPGDRILTANGEPVHTWQQFVSVIEQHAQRPLALEVERAGQRLALSVTPEPRAGEEPPVGRIGAELATPRRRAGPITAVQRGAVQTWDMVALTVDFLGGMITGRHSARNVGGPIMIAQMSGQFARLGWEAFLGFMAVLSVNLAVLNLLPIPVLDGGHLVFLGIEGARGRPLSIEQRMRLTQLGFIVLIGIMVWAIGNDLMRWFGI